MDRRKQLQVINSLDPIAKRLRERQIEIESEIRSMHATIADLLILGSEQGRDILQAKSLLNGLVKWSEWLRAHVPGLSEIQAAKYQRLTEEQITDPRQASFVFFESVPTRKPHRDKPNPWTLVVAGLDKANSCLMEYNDWDEELLEIGWKELVPGLSKRWPGRTIPTA